MKFDNWLGTFQTQILPRRSNGVMCNHDSSLIPVKLISGAAVPIVQFKFLRSNSVIMEWNQ